MDNCKFDLLMVIEGEIATTHLIERILLACENYGVRYRKKLLSELKLKDFNTNTIPFFVRCCDPTLRHWINLLHRSRHPYIYYCDDNFWKIQGESPLALYYQHPVIRNTLDFAVTHASSVLTNSDELALFLAQFNDNIQVLPAFFDFSLIDGCVRQKSEEIRIGFAGSPSRVDDLDLIRPAIFPILNMFPTVVFEFAGVMPHGIEQSERIRFFSHTPSYSAFIRFQAQRNWSIGLAPLHDNEANRCKTNNKYREYAACKIAGIYSDMQPYKKSVFQGGTGLLADQSTESWISAINRLVSNPSERNAICERAYDDVKMKHCVERVSVLWANHIETVHQYTQTCQHTSLKSVDRHLSFIRMQAKIEALQLQIQTAYKIGGVSLVMKKSLSRIIRACSRVSSHRN